ncbi:MAG: prefoldin subunit beta [Candidatus Altiarchaeales archaeon HGW-Altiarchaeales-2]|nr:MAG: prefoldin subunit beta [Candidatus Altiarchaeales archaeon HGW-Altiarchaeales-2]
MEMQDEVRNKIMQYQQMQEGLQYFMIQEQQLKSKISESEEALKKIENYNEGKIYAIVGRIMVETKKDETIAKLKEDKDIAEVRLKSMERQEAKLKEGITKLGTELQTFLQQAQPTQGGN